MFTWIFVIVLFLGAVRPGLAEPNITSCEQFERGARFSPYDVIDSMWKIFYFWADNTELNPIVFSLPAKKRVFKFKEVIDVIDPHLDLEWNKATLFMNPKAGTEVLFLYAGTPGAFRALVKVEQRNSKVRPYPTPQIKFADVRMKLVGEYLGMMCCEDLTAYALARMDDVPATESQCFAAASTLGYQAYFLNRLSPANALKCYQERYPDRDVPNSKFLEKILKKLRQEGCFQPKRKRPTKIDEFTTIPILGFFEAYPKASLREAAENISTLRMHKSSIRKVLKTYHYKCYDEGWLVHKLDKHCFQDIQTEDYHSTTHGCLNH